MMATIENTTGAEGGSEERPRCLEGSKTDRPCWRGAVERRYSNDVEPTICAEHLEANLLAVRECELRMHLDRLGAWIATWDNPKVGETRLQYHVFTMRERMVEEYWRLSVEAKRAEIIADQGPEETPLTPEQAERLAEYALRSSALFHAGQMFQDLQAIPEKAMGSGDRWQMAGAFKVVDDDVNAEELRYLQELGLR